jgi:hypothetical protein
VISRRGIWLLSSILLLVGVCACSSSQQATSGAQPATAQNAASLSPGSAAVGYVTALYSGDPNAAAKFIPPAQQSLFRYIAKGLTKTSVRAEHIKAISVTVAGSNATVVLTGTLCATNASMGSSSSSSGSSPIASAGPSAPGKLGCITNTDPQTTNPLFRISLTKTSANMWYISYATPGATPSPQPSVGSGSSSAVATQ